MSEGVDLIDIYADEEFNQVRGRRERGDSRVSREPPPAYLQWLQVPPARRGFAALNTRLCRVPLAHTSKSSDRCVC